MRKNQHRFRLVAVALGCALAAPVLILPASGSTSDGKFQIHAWNTQEPTIEAYAGLKGLASNPGGGGSEDTSDSIFSLSVAGMNLTVTEDMLAFSEANIKAYSEGRMDDIKTHPDGWQTIWTADFSGGAPTPGVPKDGSGFLYLSSLSRPATMTDIQTFGGAKDNPGKAMALSIALGSTKITQIIDHRKLGDGATFLAAEQGDQKMVAKLMKVDGEELVVAISSTPSMGTVQVQYAEDPTAVNVLKRWGNSRPSSYTLKSDKLDSVTYDYPALQNGYNSTKVESRSDLGDGVVIVNYYKNLTNRESGSGPDAVYLKEGKLYKGWSPTFGEIEISSVEDWNAKTGQNWDGNIPELPTSVPEIPFTL